MTIVDLLDAIIRGLANGSIYALIGVGLVVIFSATHVFNFAQGELLMVGTMISVTLIALNVPFIIAILIGIIAATLFALLEQKIAISPLNKKRTSDEQSDTLIWLLSTLGFALITRFVAQTIWGDSYQKFPSMFGEGYVDLLGITISIQLIMIFIIGVIIVFVLELFYKKTLLGKALRATAEKPIDAQLRGIDSQKMSIYAFMIAGMLAALAGILVAPIIFAGWSMALILGLKGFIAAAIGGLTRTSGALIGGLILGLVESVSILFIDADLRDTIALILLLLIALVKPWGILGEKPARRV